MPPEATPETNTYQPGIGPFDESEMAMPHDLIDLPDEPEPQFSQPIDNKPEISDRARSSIYVISNMFPTLVVLLGSGLVMCSLVVSAESKLRALENAASSLIGAGLMAYKSRTKDNT